MTPSLRGVFTWRERWAIRRMLEKAVIDHGLHVDARQRQLNTMLRMSTPARLVVHVDVCDDGMRVEHDDGLVLRFNGVPAAIRRRLAVAVARDRVALVHGSVREAVFEVSDEQDGRTVLHVPAARVELL